MSGKDEKEALKKIVVYIKRRGNKKLYSFRDPKTQRIILMTEKEFSKYLKTGKIPRSVTERSLAQLRKAFERYVYTPPGEERGGPYYIKTSFNLLSLRKLMGKKKTEEN